MNDEIKNTVRILRSGDQALIAEFGNEISPFINDQVHSLASQIKAASVPGVTELVPAFRSLLVCFDPAVIAYERLKAIILDLSRNLELSESQEKRTICVPCCYGGHFGPDLGVLETYSGLSRDEIIAIHSGTDYRVYMLGFLPGFAYLGGLNERIAMPRLDTPRVKIPKGSVGIGGNQTGVYPLDSPGGWRLIGSTPLDFYDPAREEPILCYAGDFIRFYPVTSADYYDIRRMVTNRTWKLEIEKTVSQ
ncbi:MAG: 5-oxoprolinase subunit PxpB [Clostridiales bacterium]|nr:5-oxoprolinase subunit PxpB [Clostridiales bacterium]